MAKEQVRAPSSMAGIMGFYEGTGGGPSLDPKGVFVFIILFIAAVKIGSMLIK